MSVEKEMYESALASARRLEEENAELQSAITEERERSGCLRHQLMGIKDIVNEKSSIQCEDEMSSSPQGVSCEAADMPQGSVVHDALNILRTIARRQGTSPVQLQEIERLLRRAGYGIRQG